MSWVPIHLDFIQVTMTYFPDASSIFPTPNYHSPTSSHTICTCGKTWYQGDAYDKKLTWAEKYYCRFCPHKVKEEKLTILRALPHEVARKMIDKGYNSNERVSKFVWDF